MSIVQSFTGTEMDYAVEVCNAVLDVWQPTPERKAIINIPVTVQLSFATCLRKPGGIHVKEFEIPRECNSFSQHAHNDRGCGVADTEMGLLAGADRVEGTLFGNGERTGNVDIVTVAMNMYAQSVDPKLDFSDMPGIVEKVRRIYRHDSRRKEVLIVEHWCLLHFLVHIKMRSQKRNEMD